MQSKLNDTKIRILAIEKILLEHKGEFVRHYVILNTLVEKYSILSTRTTLYNDMDALRAFYNVEHIRTLGWRIIDEQGNN